MSEHRVGLFFFFSLAWWNVDYSFYFTDATHHTHIMKMESSLTIFSKNTVCSEDEGKNAQLGEHLWTSRQTYEAQRKLKYEAWLQEAYDSGRKKKSSPKKAKNIS